MAGKNAGKNNKLLVVIIVLLLVFMLLLGGVLYYFLAYQNAHKGVKGGQREAAALQGSLRVMSEEEIQEELNKIVEEGMFRISIASTIIGVENGEAEMRIENNVTNRYIMQVWGSMVYSGSTTFWETIDGGDAFSKAGSLCHGWSAIPIYFWHKYGKFA